LFKKQVFRSHNSLTVCSMTKRKSINYQIELGHELIISVPTIELIINNELPVLIEISKNDIFYET